MKSRTTAVATTGTCAAFAALALSAMSQEAVTRVSVDSTGEEGNLPSSLLSAPAISADGRHVAFESSATNLVPFDRNNAQDIFVHDRVTGATVRVSIASPLVEGNAFSYQPSISADGRFVAFWSLADNLVPNDNNGSIDVFVHDRDADGNGIFDERNGVTTRVSVRSNGAEGNGYSFNPSISADGRLVAFSSVADNLVPGDLNGVADVFVHDRTTGTTKRVSVDSSGVEGNGGSFSPAISPDGRVVAFPSDATNLVAGDTNGVSDVFVHDRTSDVTERASVDSTGNEGDDASDGTPSLSFDGAIVAFTSVATNLVAGDTNGVSDVFARDRTTGLTTRLSVDSAGAESDFVSNSPSLSADGQVVVFQSYADNLVSNDTNHVPDIFAHDRTTGTTTASSANCTGAVGNLASWLPALSADGRVVAFGSVAIDLVGDDTNACSDTFVHDFSADIYASWNNYGAGFPGTLGIPTLTAGANPVFGQAFTIDIGNSVGAKTTGLLIAGLEAASIPTSAGGTILVNAIVSVPIFLGSTGLSIPTRLRYNDALCGVSILLQAIEYDPGAAYQLSFTAGLELVVGI